MSLGVKCFLFVLMTFILFEQSLAADCRKLLPKVKSAAEFVLGIDFPYWYNLGQIEAESSCLWRTSLDGIGSVGYAQITPSVWDKVLGKFFKDWKVKGNFDHFLAHAYVVKDCISKAVCKKLWNAYQYYNRPTVNREARESGCNYMRAEQICYNKYVKETCVLKTKDGTCKQYRTNCDINYSYGRKVYANGKKYTGGIMEKRWNYW